MTNKEKNRIKKTLKHQYEISIKFGGNIIVIGNFNNNSTKIEYYCIRHDEYFFARPVDILLQSRKGCLICAGREIWTTELVIKRIQFLNQDQNGNNTLIINDFEYKNIHQEIWLTCLIDGHGWKASIGNLIHSESGCLVCARKSKISYDDLHRRNNEINTDEFGVLRIIIKCTRKWFERNYKNVQTKILVGCNNPDHPDWEVSVHNLLNSESGCYFCAIETSRLTIEEFFNRIPDIFLNENGNPLHKYNLRNFNGLNSIIWIFDPDYGWFEKQVAIYLRGYGHPNSPKCKSKGELAVQDFLIANQIKFIREYKIPDLMYLRVDFFIPIQNVAIEFDGPQHQEYVPWFHETIEDFHKQQQNDRTKNQWCQDNNIQMIRITNIKNIPTQLAFLIKEIKNNLPTIKNIK